MRLWDDDFKIKTGRERSEHKPNENLEVRGVDCPYGKSGVGEKIRERSGLKKIKKRKAGWKRVRWETLEPMSPGAAGRSPEEARTRLEAGSKENGI